MPILTVILVILAVGALVMLVNKYGPAYVDAKFIKLINIIAIVGTIIWLLKILGVWAYLASVTI